MKNKIIFLVLILSALAINSFAQTQDSTFLNMPAKKMNSGSISLQSVSIFAGTYNPEMDYFNNVFLPAAHTSERFSGNMIYGANLSLSLPYNLGARIGAWYWADEVAGQSSSAFSKLKVSLTGLSIGGFYTYNKGFYGLKPYAGIDGSFLSIQDKYDAYGTVVKKSGNDFVWTPFIGMNYDISKKVIIGLEYGYVIGNYIQDVQTATNPEEKAEIGINGSKIQLSIGYKFH
jgi:opacity protein-like surface antigen